MLTRRFMLLGASLAGIAWPAERLVRMVAAAEETADPVVHRLVFDASNPDLVMKLPAGVVVLEADNEEAEALALAYRNALSARGLTFSRGLKLRIVSAGPLLDGPDKVEAAPLEIEGDLIRLTIEHTQVRANGAPLWKNVVWRPLVEAILSQDLPPGQYRVEVNWRARAGLPEGQPLGPPLSLSTRFEIRRFS